MPLYHFRRSKNKKLLTEGKLEDAKTYVNELIISLNTTKL